MLRASQATLRRAEREATLRRAEQAAICRALREIFASEPSLMCKACFPDLWNTSDSPHGALTDEGSLAQRLVCAIHGSVEGMTQQSMEVTIRHLRTLSSFVGVEDAGAFDEFEPGSVRWNGYGEYGTRHWSTEMAAKKKLQAEQDGNPVACEWDGNLEDGQTENSNTSAESADDDERGEGCAASTPPPPPAGDATRNEMPTTFRFPSLHPPPLQCPKAHALLRGGLSRDEVVGCDRCDREIDPSASYPYLRCAECDYDVCATCASAYPGAAALPIKADPVKADPIEADPIKADPIKADPPCPPGLPSGATAAAGHVGVNPLEALAPGAAEVRGLESLEVDAAEMYEGSDASVTAHGSSVAGDVGGVEEEQPAQAETDEAAHPEPGGGAATRVESEHRAGSEHKAGREHRPSRRGGQLHHDRHRYGREVHHIGERVRAQAPSARRQYVLGHHERVDQRGVRPRSGPFALDEDAAILRGVERYGAGNWAAIRDSEVALHGRTTDSVRGRCQRLLDTTRQPVSRVAAPSSAPPSSAPSSSVPPSSVSPSPPVHKSGPSAPHPAVAHAFEAALFARDALERVADAEGLAILRNPYGTKGYAFVSIADGAAGQHKGQLEKPYRALLQTMQHNRKRKVQVLGRFATAEQAALCAARAKGSFGNKPWRTFRGVLGKDA